LKKKLDALSEISDEVERGDMPLPIYLPLHPKAKLTQEDRELIINWMEQASEALLN